jgi:HK97 family phage prohead protease
VTFEVRDGGGAAGDGLTLDGLAAVFNQPTLIDSWEGYFNETIRAGAFKKSIRENTPVMQFDHGRHPLIGSIPIGSITSLMETNEGLDVTGRISDNWLMQPIRDAIAEKTVNGMSFRFSVVREEWRDNAGKLVRPDELEQLLWVPGDRGPLERTLIELKVPELGPVVFPQYVGTNVNVRARDLAATMRDDTELRREVRRSLASHVAAPGDLSDPGLRRDVARALLFGPAAPLPREHPADEEDRSTTAPLAPEHPAGSTDAPPSDGHPSPTDPTTGQALRSEISERLVFMRGHLASIADKEI